MPANSRTDFVPYRTLPHRILVKNGLCHKTAFVPPDFVPYRISSLPDFVPPDFVPNRTSSDRPLSYAGLWVAGKCRAGHCRSPAIVGSESVAPAFGQRPLTFYPPELLCQKSMPPVVDFGTLKVLERIYYRQGRRNSLSSIARTDKCWEKP